MSSAALKWRRFAGLCALLCAAMPLLAQETADEYAAGRAVYTRWCAPCHAAGVSHPGTNALTVKYAGVKSGVLLEWRDLTPEYVAGIVRGGIAVMPPFRKVEISDAQLEALARFLVQHTPAQ